jgi:hypothetical protein
MTEQIAKAILTQKFEAKHVDACLKHFADANEKFALEEWDGVALKAGKFVEAVTKALMRAGGKNLPNARQFKAGNELRQLEQLPAALHSDIVRIVIPKACIFIYEIVNNRGGRHDAADINANEMDAKAVIPLASWVLAEMIRYCGAGHDTDAAMELIEGLSNKAFPDFENIDGRPYVNIEKLGATDLALLLLYVSYPRRISRRALVDATKRHGIKASAAEVAVHRQKDVVDDDNGEWKLRTTGRRKAEQLLRTLRSKKGPRRKHRAAVAFLTPAPQSYPPRASRPPGRTGSSACCRRRQ